MNATQVLNELKVEFKKETLTSATPLRKPYLGVSYPNLKLFANKIMKDNPYDFLDSNDFSVYELEILHTIIIGKIKDFSIAIKYFKTFSMHAKEWSVVDSFCQRFIIAKKHQNEVLKELKVLAKKNDEFSQRIVAVMLLSHFINDQMIDETFSILNSLRHEGYYAKMAVAWAYATVMVKYPQQCLNFLQLKSLDPWTHKKTIQKINESFRISQDMKSAVNDLRLK